MLEEWKPANLPCSPNCTSPAGHKKQEKQNRESRLCGQDEQARGDHEFRPRPPRQGSEETVCGGALGQPIASAGAPHSPFTLLVGQKPGFQDGRQTRMGVVQPGPRGLGLKAAGADVSAEKDLEMSLTGTKEGWGARLTS